MRTLQRSLWAAAISALFAGGAVAQTTTTTTPTTTTTTGTTGTGTTTTGGATTRTGTGGTQAGSGGLQSLDLATQQAPAITAPSQSNITNSALQTSNAFNKYYANPYYQGRAGATTGGTAGSSSNTPGGFGVALYGTTGTGTGTTGARNTTGGGTARTGGATGTTSGFGGTTGTAASTTGFGATGTTGGRGGAQQGGFGGTTGTRGGQQGGTQQNNGLTTGRQISYTATLKFAAPSIPVAQMQTDLRGMIDTSSSIADAKGVSVTAGDGGVIVLKGNAKDEDEARLIENMIRLTPGVKDVKNELKFPVQ